MKSDLWFIKIIAFAIYRFVLSLNIVSVRVIIRPNLQDNCKSSEQGFYHVVSCSTNRHVLSWVSLAFIGLALSVFGWGTGYKFSLYYPPDSSVHLMPHAKLLSKNEQDSPENRILTGHLKDSSDRNKTETSLTLLFVYVLCAAAHCSVSAAGQREREVSRQWHRGRCAGLNFFFVLPPPVLA
jgi:hypothetical protein